jgi:hypothetical protein
MALADDVKKNALPGVMIGLGAALLAPALLPALATVARPLAKGAIKGGLVALQKGRERFAVAGELFDDLLAEARDELALGFGTAAGGAAAKGKQADLQNKMEDAAEHVVEEAADDLVKQATEAAKKAVEAEV